MDWTISRDDGRRQYFSIPDCIQFYHNINNICMAWAKSSKFTDTEAITGHFKSSKTEDF